jgi:hypothetical protein
MFPTRQTLCQKDDVSPSYLCTRRRVHAHRRILSSPELLDGTNHYPYRYLGFPYFGYLHIICLQHSARKIRSFLDLLNGASFEQIMQSEGERDHFRLRTSFYLMSRQYARSAWVDIPSIFRIFDYEQWWDFDMNGHPIHPMAIFAAACRAPCLDVVLAADAIYDFPKLEDPNDAEGNSRDWMHWFIHGISRRALVAGGFARKMQLHHLEAYDRAHQETCAALTGGSKRKGKVYWLSDKSRDKALALLRATFNAQNTISRISRGRERRPRTALSQSTFLADSESLPCYESG